MSTLCCAPPYLQHKILFPAWLVTSHGHRCALHILHFQGHIRIEFIWGTRHKMLSPSSYPFITSPATLQVFSQYSASRETPDEKPIWEDITGFQKPNVQDVFHLHQIFDHSFFRNPSTNKQKHATVRLQGDMDKECKILKNTDTQYDAAPEMQTRGRRDSLKAQDPSRIPSRVKNKLAKHTSKRLGWSYHLFPSDPIALLTPTPVFHLSVHKELYRPVRGRRKIQTYC